MWFKSNFTIPAVAAISFCLIGGTSPAAADILHVPGDFPTIQAAIDAAMDGDEVEVHPGTYNETINFLGKAIRVYSTDGPDVTIIDAQQTGTVVTCDTAEGPDSVLEGFTITGGNAGNGGGMYNDNSNPTVTNCTFNANTALHGGGMVNFSSSPTVTNCTFSGNTVNGDGGGMANFIASSPMVTNCTFSGNTAQAGGGMYNSTSNPTITNCTFSGNSSTLWGGGMFNFGSSPTVTDCTFSGNTVDADGGGMYNFFISNPTVTNCTFSANTAGGNGGGMFNWSVSSPTVTNCTFSANTADGGGGMCNFPISSPTVTNCTFSANMADGDGGGMFNFFESNPTVTNCTFSGNAATNDGGGMYNDESSPSVTNCILWGDSPNEIANVASTPRVTYSNIQGGFPGLGNIDADPTFVAPRSGDYHLSPGSPCIDAADNSAVPKGIDTDLDGNPRFIDDPDTDDTGFGDPPIVDMGAYEFQGIPCPWDVNGDGVVDHHDLVEVVHNLGLCDHPDNCPWDVNGDGIVNGRDVAAVATHFGACP